MIKARNQLFEEMRLALDLPMVGGGSFSWELVDPLKLLTRAIELRPGFRSLFTEAAQRSPPSAQHPWRLVIGFDGFTPGFSWNVGCTLAVLTQGIVPLGCNHHSQTRQQAEFGQEQILYGVELLVP